MHLLARTGKKLVRDFHLKPLKVYPSEAKTWRKLSAESLGVSSNVHEAEYRAIASLHRDGLDENYGPERCWWLASFHWHRADRLSLPSKDADWLSLYRTILGKPYPDFPDHLDWRIIPHRQWQRLKRLAYRDFKQEFEEKHPDAEQVEACETSQLLWQTWNEWTYAHGMETLWGTWWKAAEANLERRRPLIGLLY
jgi:hypothetical protein